MSKRETTEDSLLEELSQGRIGSSNLIDELNTAQTLHLIFELRNSHDIETGSSQAKLIGRKDWRKYLHGPIESVYPEAALYMDLMAHYQELTSL